MTMCFGAWRRLFTSVVLSSGLLGSVGLSNAQTEGIFADFTSSLGNFTCQLDFSNAPMTVANFVGLATGQRAWLDANTGLARTDPFYNGLIFHRVVAGFVDQAGSPNGTGSDGPGYAFPDEFGPTLVFANPGVLAMANSGPDSNGSQFFLTVAPFTSGNNTYAVFGRVVSGMNVVSNINQVATDSDSKPLTNVVIQTVAIRRLGTGASSFDINAQGLPLVTNPPVAISTGAGGVTLSFSNRLYSDNRFYSATNLSGPWTNELWGIEVTPPTSNSTTKLPKGLQGYFRLAQVQYPDSPFTPKDLFNRTLQLTFTNNLTGTLTNNFDSTGTGTYGYQTYTGSITNYSWSQEPYRGFLWPIYYSGLVPMTLQLNFANPTNGGFTGTAYSFLPFNVEGAFTLGGR